MNKTIEWLKSFFLNYSWLGLFIISISIFISIKFKPTSLEINILLKILESIGISVLIASIFTFASGTNLFIDKIKEILKDIVVSRNFLNNIDSKGKKEALSLLLKPSSRQTLIYSNIEDYYNTYINQALNISNKNVRSNYNIQVRVYYDDKINKVIAEGYYSYRVYPSQNGYEDVIAAFYARDTDSCVKSIIINSPTGERKVFDNPEMKDGKFGGDLIKKVIININELDDYKNQNHLDIELRLIEGGSDHWGMFEFQALQPTDGFRCCIRCENGLTIKKYSVFVIGSNYHVDLHDEQNITISCNQWINEGSGLVSLIGKDSINVTA